MENSNKKPIIDISIRKIYDIKLKQGTEIKKIHFDESTTVKTIYFLKNNKLYHLDLRTKKIKECELTKGNDIVYINSNLNHDSIICVFRSGKLIAIEHENKIKYFSNINISNLTNKTNKKEMNLDNFQVFTNNTLDKIVIVTNIFIVFWYQNNFKSLSNTGTFFNISREIELNKIGIKMNDKNYSIQQNVNVVFSNNFFLGSHSRIFYVITECKNDSKEINIYLFDYLFLFDFNDKFRSLPKKIINDYYNDLFNTEEIEDLRDINSKISKTTIFLKEKEKKAKNQKIILKSTMKGEILAICINTDNKKNSTLIFFMTETYKFSSSKIVDLIGQKMSQIFIVDMDWICNDMFLLLLMNNGTFFLLNINFQIIILTDTSNSVLPDDYYYTPMFYNINKLKDNENTQLIVSKQRDDLFLIYSHLYVICFQMNYKTYENRLISMEIPIENFDDFLYELKYFHIYLPNTEIDIDEDLNLCVLDIIHKYFLSMIKTTNGNIQLKEEKEINNSIIKTDSGIMITSKDNVKNKEQNPNNGKSETVNNLMRTFIKYIRIFRSINQIHETNLTIISYLIGKSYEFFIHLINHQEIWLAALFVELCEKYLCEDLKIKSEYNYFIEDDNIIQKYQRIIYNPKTIENISFHSYKYSKNQALYSRMRLILVFFCLIEFRNTFSLNINVLNFILAKLIIIKLKNNDLLEDILNVTQIIIKNYKYLKQDNDKVGKNEYVLNSISMSYRNEIFSYMKITKTERDDLNFEFFNEFYSIDEFNNFNDTTENYCKNEELTLIRDYNYLNNIGILQKWTVFFTNSLFDELFIDIKDYMINHLRQINGKTEENTSPEEKTLGKLIYFNFNFFFQSIQIFLKDFIIFMTQKNDEFQSVTSTFLNYSKNILDDYNKVYIPFISPVDIPFVIFHFYIQETDPNKKTLPSEINFNLSVLIKEQFKPYNLTYDDSLYFIDFLMLNGFKFETDKKDDDNLTINYMKKIQYYLYSSFLFYLFIIHKFNLIYLLETEEDMILNILDAIDYKMRKEIYEYIYIIVNGTLRHYLKMDFNQRISQNEGRYLEIILAFIKLIFYRIMREEPVEVRKNLSDFIHITPSAMKSYLLEGAFYYEYKNINNIIKEKLMSFKELLDIQNIKSNNLEANSGNIFEILLNQKEKKHNRILLKLFNKDKVLCKNFLIMMNNIIHLCYLPNYSSNLNSSERNINQNKSNLLFDIETDKDYIKKLIYTTINSSKNNDSNDYLMNIYSTIDKIIKGNFENKNHFKFSNNELKSKLIRSVKIVIVKFLHLMTVIRLKIKMLICDAFQDIERYIKYISYTVLYEDNIQNAYDTYVKLIDYLYLYDYSKLHDEKSKKCIFEALRNIHIASLKYKVNEEMTQKIYIIEEKIKNDNIDLNDNYLVFMKEVFPKIENTYDRIKYSKSSNLKFFLISSFNDSYLNEILGIYNHLVQYLNKENLSSKIPLNHIRKKYIMLCEDFYNLTGFPIKSFIEFKNNWQLIENEQIYKNIISDDLDDNDYQKGEKSLILMNRRQRVGVETPRRKRKYSISKANNKKRDFIPLNDKKNKNKRDESIDVREEKNEKNNKIKTKNKIPKFIPKSKINNSNSLLNKFERLDGIIKTIIFNRIRYYDKSDIISNESEEQKREYKIYNIKKNDIEVILLKEKFVFFYLIF